MDEQEDSLTELTEAAQRVGSTVNEHVNTVIELAERRAEEIRRRAELDAEATRRDAVESARRVFERINALEVPLGDLVETLRLEVATVERELEGQVDAEPTAISEAVEDGSGEPSEGNGTAVPAPPEEAVPDVAPSQPKAGARGRSRRRERSRHEHSTPSEEEPPEHSTPSEEEPPEHSTPSEEEPPEQSTPSEEAPPEEPSSEEVSRDGPEGQPADEGVVSEAPGPAAQSEPTPSPSTPAPVQTAQLEEEVKTEGPQPIVVSPSGVAEPPKPRRGAGAAVRVRELFSRRPRGTFSRFRTGAVSRFPSAAKSDAFITSEGYCAVCQKAFMAGSEEDLRLSGWNVNDDVGLCPDCQSDSWQLPVGARLPFRRGGV